MAAISTVLGGSLGFLAAGVGVLIFHLTALQALGLWSGLGLATLAALMILARCPRATGLARA